MYVLSLTQKGEFLSEPEGFTSLCLPHLRVLARGKLTFFLPPGYADDVPTWVSYGAIHFSRSVSSCLWRLRVCVRQGSSGQVSPTFVHPRSRPPPLPSLNDKLPMSQNQNLLPVGPLPTHHYQRVTLIWITVVFDVSIFAILPLEIQFLSLRCLPSLNLLKIFHGKGVLNFFMCSFFPGEEKQNMERDRNLEIFSIHM